MLHASRRIRCRLFSPLATTVRQGSRRCACRRRSPRPGCTRAARRRNCAARMRRRWHECRRVALRARVAAVLAVDYRPLLAAHRSADDVSCGPRQIGSFPRPRVAPSSSCVRTSKLVEIDGPHFLLQTEPASLRKGRGEVHGTRMKPRIHHSMSSSRCAFRSSRRKTCGIWIACCSRSPRRAGERWRASSAGRSASFRRAFPDVPDIYYAQRVRHLVEVGKLESQGDLHYMRYSEVRLPGSGSRASGGRHRGDGAARDSIELFEAHAARVVAHGRRPVGEDAHDADVLRERVQRVDTCRCPSSPRGLPGRTRRRSRRRPRRGADPRARSSR